MEVQRFDVIAVGGGPGATPGAQYLARHGRRVAIVEQGEGLGGTCLFEGCIPSKIFLETAARRRAMRAGSEFGLPEFNDTPVRLDVLRARKRAILAQRVAGAQSVSRQLGLTLFRGRAELLGEHQLLVHPGDADPVVLEADILILAPGSTSRTLGVPGGDGSGLWTSREALELAEIPARLAIIGAGYIGMELATLYEALGSTVHVLEMAPAILPSEDPQIAHHLQTVWEKAMPSVTVETGIELRAIGDVADTSGAKQVTYRRADGSSARLKADRVLVAVGRLPNTGTLDWERAGITLGPGGEVPVNAVYQTAVPHIYAPGDVNGQVMLAHAATRQSLIAAQHILGRPTFHTALVVPHVIFTWPEIAAVGADSRDLARHPRWTLTRWPYAQDARALIVGDDAGYAQLIWDRDSGALKGLQVIGAEAGELLAEATYAITHHGTVESLVAAIHAHPTLNEVISEVATEAWTQAHDLRHGRGADPAGERPGPPTA